MVTVGWLVDEDQVLSIATIAREAGFTVTVGDQVIYGHGGQEAGRSARPAGTPAATPS